MTDTGKLKETVNLPPNTSVRLKVTSDLVKEQQLHKQGTKGYEAPPDYFHKTVVTFPVGQFALEFVTPQPATDRPLTYGDIVFNTGSGGDFQVEVFERKGSTGSFTPIRVKATSGTNKREVRADGHPQGPPPTVGTGLGLDWDDTVLDFSW